MNCPVCGNVREENLSFCQGCGTPYTARDKAFTTAASPNKLTKPIKTSSFFLFEILKAIPIVNLVVFLVWAFSSDVNLNKKSYARAQLIWMLVGLVISAAVTAIILFLPAVTEHIINQPLFMY
jgi:hypothetical protein